MFIPFFSTALLTLFSSPVVWADFSVQTPTLTQVTADFFSSLAGRISTNGPRSDFDYAWPQCRPVNLSWDKTQGPYDILIANQSNVCGYAV